MRLNSPNISVSNPYDLDTREYNTGSSNIGLEPEQRIDYTLEWVSPQQRINEDQITSINIENEELIIRDSFGIDQRINTNENGINAPISYQTTDLVVKIASLEEENKVLNNKLEKLGDIVLDLKNQMEKLAKQKLTVNFGN